MASLDPIVRAYHRFGMALSVAQTACANNGRDEPFSGDMCRMHKLFRQLAESMGYRVLETAEGDVLAPVPADPVTIGGSKIVRPVFGKRRPALPDDDRPGAA